MRLSETPWFMRLQRHQTKRQNGKIKPSRHDFFKVRDCVPLMKVDNGTCGIAWQTLHEVQIIWCPSTREADSEFLGAIRSERTVQILLLPQSHHFVRAYLYFQTTSYHPYDYDTWAEVAWTCNTQDYLVNTNRNYLRKQPSRMKRWETGRLFLCLLRLIC